MSIQDEAAASLSPTDARAMRDLTSLDCEGCDEPMGFAEGEECPDCGSGLYCGECIDDHDCQGPYEYEEEDDLDDPMPAPWGGEDE